MNRSLLLAFVASLTALVACSSSSSSPTDVDAAAPHDSGVSAADADDSASTADGADATPTCASSANACANCQSQHCCTELAACEADQPCAAAALCVLTNCSGLFQSAYCLDKCDPGSEPAFHDFASCMAASCESECESTTPN